MSRPAARRLALPALAVALAATAVPCQTRVRTLPKVFAGHDAPSRNTSPFAWPRYFFQYWYRGDQLKRPWPITALGWRIDSNVVAPAQSIDIEIVLSNTAKSFANLDRTFKNNLGPAPMVFFKKKRLRLPAQNRPSDPSKPAVWISGDQPFFGFRGPHLIVQVDTSNGVSSRYVTDAYTMAAGSTLHTRSLKSCDGTRLTAAYDSSRSRYSLTMTGGRPRAPAILMVGADNEELSASVGLPLDLGALGAPGCALGLRPAFATPLQLDAGGRLRAEVVTGFGDSFVLHAQVANRSTANRLGWTTSNMANSILGARGLSNYLYNWTTFGPVAQFGPFPHNVGIVLLTRP